MSSRAKRILEEAQECTSEEKAGIAYELLASLDEGAETGVDEAWAKEIARRAAEAEAGQELGSECFSFLDGLAHRLHAAR